MFRLANAAKKILYFSLVLTSLSCAQGKLDPHDLTTGLSRSEIEKLMFKNSKEEKLRKAEKAQNESPIPSISKLIVSPPPPSIGGDKIISFSVTEQVPLKDVLTELGRVANIDVDLDPNISGGVIINAKNRPLKEVIDRIATLGALRYSYVNGVLHFERDTPYMKNYYVDYLIDGTLWKDVEANITSILAYNDNPAAADPNASSLGASTKSGSSFSSNKSAGIIAINATDHQHTAVTKYLADVEKYTSAQVLIEAKVVEVKLNKEFSAGVKWDLLNSRDSLTSVNGFSGGGALTYITTGILNADINFSINALEKFGTTKTLSSPRVHAMNNQKATLNFTDKLVYFKIEQAQSTASNGATTATVQSTITSTKQEENVGVSLEITPSINLKTGEIVMNIKPKVSIQSDTVIDPASPRTLAGDIIVALQNSVPVIQTRELSTIAKLQSGNVFVIGGLMKETSTDTDSGVPFLQRIPILGWLFKSVSKVSETTETVIFIKATIINSGTQVPKVDRTLQEKFDPNRRRYFE